MSLSHLMIWYMNNNNKTSMIPFETKKNNQLNILAYETDDIAL